MQSAAGKEVTSLLALLVQKYKYLFTSTKLQILTPEQLQLRSGPANLRKPVKRVFTTYSCLLLYLLLYLLCLRSGPAKPANLSRALKASA